MDSSDCLEIEVGDINHILSAKSEFISANYYLSNITARLEINLTEHSSRTEIIL